MFKFPQFAIGITTLAFLAAILFLSQKHPFEAVGFVFFVGPLLLIWMAVSIFKDPKGASVPPLNEKEWSYQDTSDIKPVE